MKLKFRKAQGATEYAIFIAAVLAGLLALQVYYNRAVKGNVKARADSIGEVFNANSTYNLQSTSVGARKNEVGYKGIGSAWSNSTIRDRSLAMSGQIGGVAHGPSKVGNYTGGEISYTDYVTTDGTHTTLDLGNITTKASVWNDSGL